MEKAMAPHSSTLAWKIPWTEEPGRLQSTGSLRVGHDWATSLWLFTFMHWRRKWQPTPVFLPGESHGQRSLVGCRLWGRTESDTTEATWQAMIGPVSLCVSVVWSETYFCPAQDVYPFPCKVHIRRNHKTKIDSLFFLMKITCIKFRSQTLQDSSDRIKVNFIPF